MTNENVKPLHERYMEAAKNDLDVAIRTLIDRYMLTQAEVVRLLADRLEREIDPHNTNARRTDEA